MKEYIVQDIKDTPTDGYACRECNRMFTGVQSFDMHRKGKYGERYCDTSRLPLDSRGYYRTPI